MSVLNIRVEAAKTADAAVLAQLGAVTFYDTFRPFNSEEDMQAYIQKAYNEGVIQANLNNPMVYYAIAFDGEVTVGYCKLLLGAAHPKLSGEVAELEKIYVLQSHIGTGTGRQLLKHAIGYAKSQEFNQLFLGVWQENKRAVSFYKKAGFEVFDTRSFQLGNRLCEDYMMTLMLV